MPLSANTLIHFTREKESLKSILADSFRIFYCRETIQVADQWIAIRVPMVSFCDIPLSEVKDHISKYGHYGIGMTKDWAVKNCLNPVLYIASASSMAKSYRLAYQHFTMTEDDDSGSWTDEQRALADLIRYMKNYEAPLERKGTITENYRFSDEREWRYVPHYAEKCEMVMSDAYYSDNKVSMDGFLEPMRLGFGPNDIKYIIIDDDSEIGEFIDHIRKVWGRTGSLHDIERLTTRIFTKKQIDTDI